MTSLISPLQSSRTGIFLEFSRFSIQTQQQLKLSSPTWAIWPPPKYAEDEAIRMLLKTLPSVGTTIDEVENHLLAVHKLDLLKTPKNPWKELDPDFLLLKLASFLKTLPSPTATFAEVRDSLVTFPCEDYAVDELDQHFLLSVSKLDIMGASILAMSYCELRLYLYDAGFNGPPAYFLAAYLQAAMEVEILKEIQMLIFKRGNANRFTRVDIWNFVMMAMAPFCRFYSA